MSLRIRAGSATGAESAVGGAESAGTGPREATGTGPGESRDREAAAYLARLQEQVKGHGRWHGLR